MIDDPLSSRGTRLMDRRQFLSTSLDGLAAVALTGLLGQEGRLAAADLKSGPSNTTRRHFPARASRVIEIFCAGALSHVDTFDYKPELVRRHGQPLPGNDRFVSFQGENGNLVQPLWEFQPRGQSGKMVSTLVDKIGGHVDELCFFHSLTTKTNTHGPAENAMSTGFAIDGFPSKGAWINYALGSANKNLPTFVAIEDPRGMPQAAVSYTHLTLPTTPYV